MSGFRWDAWNVGHIAAHGMSPADAEYIVLRARRPYPQLIGEGKRLVLGQAADGMYAQVIYVLRSDSMIYVIHPRPLNDAEKRKYRRRIR